jgi:hypothetical protein
MKYNINLLDNKIPGSNVLDPVSDLVDTIWYRYAVYLHPGSGSGSGSSLFYQETGRKTEKVIEIKK